MRIVFCIYEFSRSKLMLQPWLTIKKIAEFLVFRGYDVHIITDIYENYSNKLCVHIVKSLRGTNSEEISTLLKAICPDIIIFLPTPLNIITSSWLSSVVNCRRIGFVSYPFYNYSELFRAWKCLPWRIVKSYLKHLVVPGAVARAAYIHRCEGLIVQSQSTMDRVCGIFDSKIPIKFIPPGIDLAKWPLDVSMAPEGSTKLLYLGAATAIRGFDITLESLAMLRDVDVDLRVLARGATSEELATIYKKTSQLGIRSRVTVVGGWVDQDEIVKEIQGADIVLQPFVLVPSELPVTAMEVIACGTPVISSDIDGMPSSIGVAGTVFKQGCAASLAEKVKLYSMDANIRLAWRNGCLSRRSEMLSWDAIAGQWEGVILDGR